MANPVVHVVILCQGQQSRLPALLTKKQLLPLYRRPDGSEMTILSRTIAQVRSYLPTTARITVIGDSTFASTCRNVAELCTLGDPGNSSLKGLERYLMLEHGAPQDRRTYPYTIVLLGDVIYTYEAIGSLIGLPRLAFSVSQDLSLSGGELWGMAWPGDQYGMVHSLLNLALLNHPPSQVDGTYQPGQMRRVLWMAREHILDKIMYDVHATGKSYIMDVDIPSDLLELAATIPLVERDDAEVGLHL